VDSVKHDLMTMRSDRDRTLVVVFAYHLPAFVRLYKGRPVEVIR
jgi:hypothetical protein